MPNNLKEKKCRGKKYNLRANGMKVNFRLFHHRMRKTWLKMS